MTSLKKSKRGLEFQTIVIIIITTLVLAVFIAIFFFGDNALLKKIAKSTEGFTDWILGSIKGDTSVNKQIEEKDKNVEKTFKSLEIAIKQGIASSKTPCILTYQRFPDDASGQSITIEKTSDGILMQQKNKQVIDHISIPDAKLCVVSGKTAVKNFYDNCVKSDSDCSRDKISSSFVEVDSITLSEGSLTKGQLTDAKINYKINGKERTDDLENYVNEYSSAYLFMPNPKQICFIPTRDDIGSDCDSGGDVLDDDCIAEIQDKLTSSQKTGKIKYC